MLLQPRHRLTKISSVRTIKEMSIISHPDVLCTPAIERIVLALQSSQEETRYSHHEYRFTQI